MGKRGNGEGSVIERGDGRWMGRISLPDGSRKTIYGKTRQEVSKQVASLIHDRERGIPQRTDERMKLGAFLEQWLANRESSLGEMSHVRYGYYLRHIASRLGNQPLTHLTPAMIESCYAYLQAPPPNGAGLAGNTVSVTHTVLKEALKSAVRHNLLSRNPADLVDAPKKRQNEIHPLDMEQSKAFLEAVEGDRLEALYSLALTTGMRQGEMLALQWRDIDFDKGRVSVNKTLHYKRGAGFSLSYPKTRYSRRLIPLMPETIEALRRRKVEQAEERLAAGSLWNTQWPDLIFASRLGGPLYVADLTERSFRRLLRRAQLPIIRFHDLRHTAATLMLLLGISPKVVSERLGHASVKITLDLYSHVLPGMQEEATDILRRALYA